LIDEADTFLKNNEELRGVLNSGHTRTTAFVVRVEGESHEPFKFSTWGPKAIAMIGTMPDTLQDRSVVIQLRRKAPGEIVSRLDLNFENECLDIRRKCQRWADDNLDKLSMTRPGMPNANNDRMMDNWMPLFAIADVAGGDWPELIKKSMLKMMYVSDDSIGSALLEDIKDIFDSNLSERIFSDDLVEALKDKSERPWCDWNRGKGLSQNGLARLLKPFDVKSKTIRIKDEQRKGYVLEDFRDAFKRYISSFSPSSPFSSVPPYQNNDINNLGNKQSVPNEIDGADEKQRNQLNLNDWYAGTDEKGVYGGNKEKETISSVTRIDKFSKENKKISMEI
jgi:putative DNA primase/helicase